MTTVFSSARGSAVVVDEGRPALPLTITLGGASLSFGVITQFNVEEAVNFSASHTLNDAIYAAIFGDRATDLRIGGLAFARVCRGGSAVSGQYQHTIEEVIKVYHANKASKVGKPQTVVCGRAAYKGLLIGKSVGIVDPETKIAQWSFRYLASYDQQVS